MQADPKLTRKKDMAKLRTRMDGDDNFMNAHQIKKVRTREREIPAWTLNNKEVQKLITRTFPNWRTRRADAAQAGRWTRIIHLYYRMQMPSSAVAKELGMGLNTLKMALKSIRRVARGQRADNTGPLGARPKGRPRKSNS